jgi:hypothetical protein
MSRCVLCGQPHERRIEDRPAMYCAECTAIRVEAKHTLTHVLDTLYLGDALGRRSHSRGVVDVADEFLKAIMPEWDALSDQEKSRYRDQLNDMLDGPLNPMKGVPARGMPISQLSGRPGAKGFDAFCEIARSWGYD